ncbi:hypothetical protein PanWU01x14_326060, partial [Parasponia andersonii]
KDIIVETQDLKTRLELINKIRKLGLTYHFEDEIKKALDTIASTYNSNNYHVVGEDLYLTSLYFRLLRQHGYQVSQVKDIIVETQDLKTRLELINKIRKLGLTYHFEDEIKKALDTIASTYNSNNYHVVGEDLYLTSLYFRLLRQHGYQVSQDMFSGFNFMDKKCVTQKGTPADTKVMLELLEASHVALEGENILDEAKVFVEEKLKITISNNLDKKKYLLKHATHAL